MKDRSRYLHSSFHIPWYMVQVHKEMKSQTWLNVEGLLTLFKVFFEEDFPFLSISFQTYSYFQLLFQLLKNLVYHFNILQCLHGKNFINVTGTYFSFHSANWIVPQSNRKIHKIHFKFISFCYIFYFESTYLLPLCYFIKRK